MENAHSNLEDQILVMDAQDGDAEAMEKLVGRFQKCLWHHAYRLTSDRQGAWDITQQVWLAIIKGLRKLNDPAAFRSWAYRITTNKSYDWIKKKSDAKETPIDSIAERPATEQVETGIKELLNKLDPAKKIVICLHYFDQLSVHQISLALSIPQGTVKSRLHNARNELKELWQQQCR